MSFIPTTLYDYPSVLLAQAIDGELSASSLDPHKMTPSERETVAQKVTAMLGWQDDQFLGSVVDTVLNPWVLLMAGTSALGGFKLPVAGKLWHGMENTSAFVRQHGGVSQALKLLSPGQMMRGTFLEGAFMQASKEIESLSNASIARLSSSLEDVSKRLSLPKGLASDAPLAKEVNDLLYIKLAGLDQAREVVARGQKGAVIRKQVSPLVSQEIVDARIRELGIEPLLNGVREEFTLAKKMLFGKDGVEGFELDGEKVFALQRNLRSGVFRGNAGQVMEGIIGEDLVRLALKEGSSREEVVRGIAERFAGGLDEMFYMPRNQYVTRDINGRLVPPEVKLSRREGATLATTNAAAARQRAVPLFDVDDLERLKNYAADTTEIENAIERSREALLRKAAEGASQVRFDKIDFAPAFERYMNDAIRSKALFLSRPSDFLKSEVSRALPAVQKAIDEGKHRIPSRDVAPKFEWDSIGGKQTKSVLDGLEGDEPIGGWSVADVIWQGHQLTNDRVVQNAIGDLFVPTLLGQTGPRGALMSAVQLHAQKATRDVVIPALKPVLDGMGEFGQGVLQKLDEFSVQPVGHGKGWSTGTLSGYLYSSHLGLNLGTATLNLTQPFITTGRLVEMPYVLQGMKDAFTAIQNYSTGRAKNLKAFLSPAEKWDLMTKSAAVDVLEDAGIGPSALELVDAVGFTGSRLGMRGGPMDKVVEGTMKVFEKTEWFNRLTTVFAQRAKQVAAGLDPLEEAARQEVRSLVAETQFGGHWLNTPQAFLDPKSPLSNPLLRQFSTFPIRMATLTTNVAPGVGGDNRAMNHVRDLIRGLGISALVYEAGKSYLGPGIERGLFAGTVTDLVANPPTPPAVDIPMQLIKSTLIEPDMDAVKKEIPRLFPGGVAISRALGMAPNLEGTPVAVLQRQYVDWNRPTPEGLVPLMKGDGSLVEFVDPMELVARKIGLSRFEGDAAARDKWLLGQRDQILDYRKKAIESMMRNDSQGAARVAEEFKRRFGFDLTVSEQQIKQYQRLQTVPRTDRILERLPAAVRPAYLNEVGLNMEANTGIPRESLNESFARRQAQKYTYAEVPAPQQAGSFTPFSPF